MITTEQHADAHLAWQYCWHCSQSASSSLQARKVPASISSKSRDELESLALTLLKTLKQKDKRIAGDMMCCSVGLHVPCWFCAREYAIENCPACCRAQCSSPWQG
jgi:hypothetical protein